MKYIWVVFGSTGFMDSQKGDLLKVFKLTHEKEARAYANQMMGFVEKWEVS